MGGEQILVIEDDASVALFFSRVLEQEGYTVTTAYTGARGYALAQELRPDLILLDLIMPDMYGLDLCRQIRRTARFRATPLLIVTACAAIDQRVAGLDAGADDYITKPLIAEELCARVRAQLRRTRPLQGPPKRLQIDHATNAVIIDGRSVALTLREYQLLAYLLQHAGSACTQEQLVRAVWGCAPEHLDPGTLRWHIFKLRERIEPDRRRPRYIHTVKQRGYMYRDPASL